LQRSSAKSIPELQGFDEFMPAILGAAGLIQVGAIGFSMPKLIVEIPGS